MLALAPFLDVTPNPTSLDNGVVPWETSARAWTLASEALGGPSVSVAKLYLSLTKSQEQPHSPFTEFRAVPIRACQLQRLNLED